MKWFYWLLENPYTRYPLGIAMGFLIQNMYLPKNSKTPFEGMLLIISLCLGTCIAYYLKSGHGE